jgi:hypothetical protein
MRRLALSLAPVVFLGAAEKVEILCDDYGVPHIFASTGAGEFVPYAKLPRPASDLLRFSLRPSPQDVAAQCDDLPPSSLGVR